MLRLGYCGFCYCRWLIEAICCCYEVGLLFSWFTGIVGGCGWFVWVGCVVFGAVDFVWLVILHRFTFWVG